MFAQKFPTRKRRSLTVLETEIMALNFGMAKAETLVIDAPVGLRNRSQNVANNTRDQTKIMKLLAAIPASQGGKKETWATLPLTGADRQCPKHLADAIWDFQTFWKKRGLFAVIDGVVDPGKRTLKRMNDLVYGAPEPTARRLQYDVPLVVQTLNPICWVCSMAMVASERRKVSVSVSSYIHGFDPSFGSIPNPNDFPKYRYKDYVNRLNRCGFTSINIDSAQELEETLRERGPLILTHLYAGFPYNLGKLLPKAPPGAAHAVVITGIDVDSGGGQTRMNNPWGYKNVPLSVDSALEAGRKLRSTDGPAFAYFRAGAAAP
jgi:hypothetical protein